MGGRMVLYNNRKYNYLYIGQQKKTNLPVENV